MPCRYQARSRTHAGMLDGMDEFAEVLRAWRDRVDARARSAAAGRGPPRPGLRREELAGLAGRERRVPRPARAGPGPQPVAAAARRAGPRAAAHRRRARPPLPGRRVAPPSPQVVSQHIAPGVQRMLDRLGDCPIAVFSAAWDLLQWNPLWAALTGDPRRSTVSIATSRGGTSPRPRHHRLRRRARRGVLRRPGRRPARGCRPLPGRPRAAAAGRPAARRVAGLRAPLGQAHVARHRSSRKTATATPVGPITVDCDVLTAPGTDLRIVIYTAAPGSDDASKLDLLRVSGMQVLASG